MDIQIKTIFQKFRPKIVKYAKVFKIQRFWE